MSGFRSRLFDLGMNERNCSALVESVNWTDIESIIALFVLLCIDIIVITGNTMVIMAVYMTSKLRSSTNLFIVSLAVADLMVGLLVLPLSSTREVFKVWIFGDFLCSVWLAVDVWMCTASILNLCAISLDRYIAVTRPVTYPNIMSMKRAKILVCLVWVLSFIICLPPLVNWRERIRSAIGLNSDPVFLYVNASTQVSTDSFDDLPCPWVCNLTSDTGYVVYSALGSFYIPMFVMLFFYWRIYRAAVQTTQAINRGFRTTKTTTTTRNRYDESRLTLRIHRGRGSSVKHNSTCTLPLTAADCSAQNSPYLRSPDTRLRRGLTTRRFEHRGHERVKISVSYPSSDCLNTLLSNNNAGGGAASDLGSCGNRSGSFSSTSPTNSGGNLYAHYACSETTTPPCHLRVGGGRLSETTPRRCSAGDTIVKTRHLSEQLSSPVQKELSSSPSFEDNATTTATSNHRPKSSKLAKRNIRSHVRRFKMETKAAKTLGIIVGGFVFCWLPFFTLYLIRAFCDPCVHPIVFSVMFWLGYCNSAINPMIYALFSKDFRFAFHRIICGCFTGRFSMKDTKNTRRGSDGSQLGVCRRADRSPSCNDFPMSNVQTSSERQRSESDVAISES